MPLTVAPARDEDEVRLAVATLWPHVVAGQAGYSLAGLASPEALTEAWSRCQARDGQDLLLARDGDEVVGAWGVATEGDDYAQTVNGPVAARDHEAVYDALLADARDRYPGAGLLVGVSGRHTRALAWLRGLGAEPLDHSWPYEGPALPGPVPAGVRRLTEADQPRFRELYDRVVGQDLWWTAERICEVWDEWVCVADDAWTSVLAGRLFRGSPITEVFGAAGTGAEVLTRLAGAWTGEAARAGYTEAVWFCETPEERAAAEACGLTCDDEYLLHRVAL